jgi:hypothetical protein
MKYEDKVEELAELNEEAIIYHDIEDALVGWIERMGMAPVAVYDYDKVIEVLAKSMGDGDDAYESAIEWYNYNTLGTWAGDGTPVFLHKFEEHKCDCSRTRSGLLTKIGKKIMAIRKS